MRVAHLRMGLPEYTTTTKGGNVTIIRYILVALLSLFALLMLISVFTLPAIAATAPAVLLVGSVILAVVAWPKHSR